MTRWHVFERAHKGFWDDPEGTASTTATASASIGPSTTYRFDPLFDANLIVSSDHALTFTYPISLDSFLSAEATTATVTLNSGFDVRLEQLSTFANPVAFNGLLQGQQTVKVQTLDSVLITAGTTLKSTVMDAALSASFTRVTTTALLDGCLFKTDAKTVNADSLLLKVTQHTVLHQFDVVLMRQVPVQFLTDAVTVPEVIFSSPILFDAILNISPHPFVSFDAQLQLLVPATGADSVLVDETVSGTRLTKTNSLDAILQLVVPAAGADAVLT